MLKISLANQQFDVEVSSEKDNTAFVNGSPKTLDLVKIGENQWHILHNNKSYNAELVSFNKAEKSVVIKINGREYPMEVKDKFDLILDQMGLGSANAKKAGDLKAPMPGLVLDIKAGVGDSVKKGDTLLVLEAMKMENSVKSPSDGTVKKIAIEKGQAVEKGALLIAFE